MQICQPHWDRIRALIDEHGMAHMVGTPQSAFEQMAGELTGEAPPDTATTFDPLLRVNSMLMGRAIEQGGLYMMSGNFCPVCEAVKHLASVPRNGETEPAGAAWVEQHWTEGAVLAVKSHAIELGAIPPQQ